MCNDSVHKHHQIQLMINVDDHDKTLHWHSERVKTNHEYSEPSSQFISLLYACFQLDCLSPQHRAQSAYLSYGDSLPTTEKPSSNQVTELQSLAYSGCWYWIIYQQYCSGWILRMTQAFTQIWWFLLKGYCRHLMMYADRCHHGPVQVNSFNDAVRENCHYMEWKAAQ